MGKSIGVLYADKERCGLTHDFFSAILESFMRTIEAKGYHMSFINNDAENHVRFLEQIRNRQYSGVLVACTDFEKPEVQEIFKSGIPCVTVDDNIDGVVSVLSDNETGMKELVEYIIEMGHKRIAYICGHDSYVTRTRIRILMDTCREHGIELPAEYLKKGLFRDTELTAFCTEELLRLPDPPTCIICPDDYASVGCLNILRARGMDVPGDISIAAFDGLPIMSLFEPKMTTVVQDKEGMGRAAGESLIKWIEDPDYVLENKIIIPAQLEKGRSVARIYY